MIAWKFFAPGAVAPFTGVRWPSAGWVHSAPGPDKGVHACAIEHLPYWIDEELWEVELDAPVSRAARQLVGGRGRLVARVDDWPVAQPEFTAACVDRTRGRIVDALLRSGHAAQADRITSGRDPDGQREAALAIAGSGPAFVGYLADVIRRRPYPGACAYIAARAAAVTDGLIGHDEERAAQVEWLANRLQLAHR